MRISDWSSDVCSSDLFQVHLVDDAGVGRHHLEVLERFLPPAQEAVALLVALELDLAVEVQRVRTAEHVDLHRVVGDKFRRDQRVDLVRLARSDERRVGKECVSTCRSWWSPNHYNKKYSEVIRF